MKKPYTGKLAKPMQELLFPPDMEKVDEILEKDRKERIEKIRLLLKHYNIDINHKNAWFNLSYSLALDHVPGFRRKKLPGAKLKWGYLECQKLREDIDKCIAGKKSKGLAGHSVSVNVICKELAKKEPWKALTSGKSNPTEILRRQYYSTKSLSKSISLENVLLADAVRKYAKQNKEKL